MVLVRVIISAFPPFPSPVHACLPRDSTRVLSTQEEQMIIKSLGPHSPAKGLKPVWLVASLCKMHYVPPVGPVPPSSTVAGAESLSGWDYASQGGSQLTTS